MAQWAQGDHSIAFGIVGATAATGAVSGNEITYPDAFTDANVQYQVLADRLKESIVLNAASAPTSYAFTLRMTGLTFKQQPDGSIVFSDAKTGAFVAAIPAPIMYDATDATSTDVVQTITNNGNGTATLSLAADASWIHDPARKFPIVIDPTVTNNSTALGDTFVSQTYPTTNYAGSTYSTDVAGYSSYYGLTTSLFNFGELPALPPGANGATIESAKLEAYQTNASEDGTPIEAQPITSSWNYQAATWDVQPSYGSVTDTQTAASSPASTSNAYQGTWSFDVTPSVRQWYSEQANNYGIALTTGSSATAYATFASENDTQPAPYLSITYTVQPVGDEPYWTQTGDGVNVADGNLEVQQTDLATPGRGIPVSVTRTFNSFNVANEPPGHVNLFGDGWSSNLDMSIANWGNGPIVFTDASGLQHVFVPNGASGQYISTGAEHMTLTLPSAGGFQITQEDGTVIDFNSNRQLMSIQAPTPNGATQTTTLLYNSSGQLDGIEDASGRTWTVTLNSNGTIHTITDSAGRAMTYSYDSSGLHLTGSTLAAEADSTDTTTVQYGYSTAGQLTSMIDPNGNTTTYSYVSGTQQVKTVSRTVTVNGSPTTATDSYNYSTDSSGDPTTTVTNADGHETLYTIAPGGEVQESQVDPSGLDLKTTYEWNQDDQLTSETGPNGNTTTYQYDNSGPYNGGTGVPITATLPNGSVENDAVNANGEVVSATTPDGGARAHNTYSNTVAGDSTNTLGKTSAVNLNNDGQPVGTSAPLGLGQNLIPNGSFEDVANELPTDWQDPSGNGVVTDTTSTAQVGAHSVEMQAGSTSPTDLLQNESMPVHPNESYILTFWIKTSGVAGVSTSTGMIGAVVNAHWYSSPGTSISDTSSDYLGNTLGTSTWTRQTVTITAPANANYVNLNLVLYGTTGTAYFDGLQLAPVGGVNNPSTNALLNSSFTNNYQGATLPDNWSFSTDAQSADRIDTTAMHNGMPSVSFEGGGSSPNTMSQTVTVPATVPATVSPGNWSGVSVSGWSKQSGATTSGSPTYDLSVTASYPGTTYQNTFSVPFSLTALGWQYVMDDLSASQLMYNSTPPDQLTVTADYGGANEAEFNDLQLHFLGSSAPSSTYNLLENPGFENQYNGGALPDYWAASGVGSASTSTLTSTSGPTDTYTGQHALAVTAPTSGTAPETVSSTLAVPFDNRNFTLIGYVHTSGFVSGDAYLRVDALGSTGNVIASFDSQKIGGTTPWTRVDVVVPASDMPSGTDSIQVTTAVDPDTSGAHAYFDDLSLLPYDAFSTIQYDSNSNYVTSAADELGNAVTYGYGNDNTGGGFSANFTGTNTGDPSQMTTANGYTSYFAYNKEDQIVAYTYTYQNGGTTASPTFDYTYDQNGNLTGIQDPTGHAVSNTYNQLNEPTSQTETVSGVAQTTKESYDAAGLLTSVTNPNGTTESITYDNAGRVTGETDSNGSITDTFATKYLKNNVASVSQNSDPAYTFDYGSLNNITSDGQPFSSSIT
ncbi:MAG: DNRLRE domain-containing protein, partial [Firmicutes bacterium]|nr:DNRLRE domain-containing protein [Bacillota bacterium]